MVRETNTLENSTPEELSVGILEKAPLLRIKLSRALFCPPQSCGQALAEVIKFMALAAARTNSPLTPSARVDLAWHEFILFTRLYERFCQQNFGKMIHHEPSDDHQQNMQQYRETLRRYREIFGAPPHSYWGGIQSGPDVTQSAHCGNCEAIG